MRWTSISRKSTAPSQLSLLALAHLAAAGHDDRHLLAEEHELGLVADEAEHDEVSVEAVKDVLQGTNEASRC